MRDFDNMVTSTMEICMFASIPLSVAFCCFSKEILTLLFDKAMVEHAYTLLTLLSPAIIFVAPLTVVNTALEARGKVRVPLYSMLCAAPVKLIVSYILMGREEFGIAGAPVGTSMFYLVSLVISGACLFKDIGIKNKSYITLFRPLLNSLGAVAISKIVANALFGRQNGTLCTVFMGCIYAVLYLVFSLMWGNLNLGKVKKLSICTKQA
jgi:stage V sporulation protein B